SGPAGTDSATRHRCDEVRPGRSPGHSPSMVSALDCLVFSTLVMTSSDFSRVPTPTAKTMAVTMKQASSPQPKVSNPRLPSPYLPRKLSTARPPIHSSIHQPDLNCSGGILLRSLNA